MARPIRWTTYALALWCLPLFELCGQTPADTIKPYTLPPTTVTVTRTEQPLNQVPRSVLILDPVLLIMMMGGSRFAYRSSNSGTVPGRSV